MTTQRHLDSGGSGLLHPGWSLALPLLALTAFLASPPERRLWTVLAAAPLFALMQWLVPKCRLRTGHYFSPVNVALLLLLLKMLIAPLLIMAAGASNDLFTGIPSLDSMNGAVVIDSIAYVALCLGLAFTPAPGANRRSSPWLCALAETPSLTVVLIFATVGLLGFALAFGTPGRLLQYFLEPTAAAELQQEAQGSWSGFLGMVLRPFFAFALVAAWARSVDRADASVRPWRVARLGLLAALGVTLANLTFSFNRAAFVFPLLCLVAVYSARTRRIAPLATASALAVLLPLLMALGSYRASMLAPVTAPAQGSPFTNVVRAVSENIQSYAGGPALTGLFFEQQGWGDRLYGGSTLLASVLSPVPVLGKNFRETNGSALYNQALYGVSGYEDQIIPFSAELFVNFHAAGVAAGFFALGLVLGWAHAWFTAVGSAFGAFAIQYASLWTSLLAVWSLGIVSQIALYFLWPVYVYWAAMHARAWLRGMRFPRTALSISRFGETSL